MLFVVSPAVSQQSQPAPPLTEPELRVILDQLILCESAVILVKGYEKFVEESNARQELIKTEYAKSLELRSQEVDLAKQATALMKERYDIAAERAKFFEDAYNLVTKKTGLRCRILSAIFTLGMWSCK